MPGDVPYDAILRRPQLNLSLQALDENLQARAGAASALRHGPGKPRCPVASFVLLSHRRVRDLIGLPSIRKIFATRRSLCVAKPTGNLLLWVCLAGQFLIE